MLFYPFSPHQLVTGARLPLTLISLEDWALISVSGIDSEKYLQGQLTADVCQIGQCQHLLAAHCDPKGKIWNALRLFRRQRDFVLIERRSLRDIFLTELRKYAIFSKVSIVNDDEHILFGVAGFQARARLEKIFNVLPGPNASLVNEGATSLLWFEHPIERFLLVTDMETAECLTGRLNSEAQKNNSQQWLALNIEAGDPVIDVPNSRQFIPQAANFQALGGISFKKGCYIGQEVVTRTKFRGTNKLSLYYLRGFANRVPEVGEDLELKIGENWRRTGTVLAAARADNNSLLVQAIMSNGLQSDRVLRVRGDTNTLSIKTLPYSLDK